MKTAAVIAEFNPFHLGHAYLFSEIRKIAEADHLIVVMSGDFVQRGEPAVTDKYSRTAAALKYGADIIIELPLCFSLGSAAHFAEGAVKLLDSLHCVDELWFGSECGDITALTKISNILSDEPWQYSVSLKENLKKGLSYPLSRLNALRSVLPDEVQDSCCDILSAPNNILALEYCIALNRLRSGIVPRTVTRKGSSYDSVKLGDEFSSAAAIRKAVKESRYMDLYAVFPGDITAQFESTRGTVFSDDFSHMLRYKIMSENADSLMKYQDIGNDLALRIKNTEDAFTSLSQYALLLKTKNNTYSHISRNLFHILLGITDDDIKEAYERSYVRVLGFNKESSVLNIIKQNSAMTLCTKPSLIKDDSYKKELFASNLYEAVQSEKANRPFVHEFSKKAPVIINS